MVDLDAKAGDACRRAATCKGCIHFFVTYDPHFPYGCRSMGFKSRRYPHVEVEEATGESCQAHQTKISDEGR